MRKLLQKIAAWWRGLSDEPKNNDKDTTAATTIIENKAIFREK
jgi:hypothetical protein